jgi:hypothetical protein
VVASHPIIFGIAGFLIAPGSARSHAGDWRYCLGISTTQYKIYMSNPFPATRQSDAEHSFGQALDKSDIQHDSVQCPLNVSEKDAWLSRANTVQFNAGRGYALINIDWNPPAGLGHNF